MKFQIVVYEGRLGIRPLDDTTTRWMTTNVATVRALRTRAREMFAAQEMSDAISDLPPEAHQLHRDRALRSRDEVKWCGLFLREALMQAIDCEVTLEPRLM